MKNSVAIRFQHPFFAGMDADHVEEILAGAHRQEFAAGEIIFREGDPANQFYLIESGEVAIESTLPHGGMVHIQTVRSGDVLGWSWLFPPFAWHFRARAIQPTHVLVCDGAHLLVQAEEHPTFGYELMKRVSQVLIQRLQASRKKLVQAMRG